MSFAQIIGHQNQLASLRLALSKDRLHQAYLFAGPEGVGKRLVALSLAKAVHCSESSGDFCGRCADCMRVQDGNHPDVRVIEPLEGKKEISIQQVREIERDLQFRSFSGKRKLAVFDPATLLNQASQNALLKTLEEPPRNSMIILIATNAGALLPTLRSRCLRLAFGPLARETVAGFFMTHQGLTPQDAELLAAMSMGSLGAALNLDREELASQRRLWLDILPALGSGDYRKAIVAAEGIASNRDETLKFLEWAAAWYRDLMVHGSTQNPQEIINLDMIAEIERQCAEIKNIEDILAACAQTRGAAGQIQRNLNRRMVLEKLLLNLAGAR